MDFLDKLKNFTAKLGVVTALVLVIAGGVLLSESFGLINDNGSASQTLVRDESVKILPDCPDTAIINIDDSTPSAFEVECMNQSNGGQEKVTRFIEPADMTETLKAHIIYDPSSMTE